MRKWMISLLSVLALAFMFSGCSDDSGSVSSISSIVDEIDSEKIDDEAVDVAIDNGNVDATIAEMPFALSAALGTPPGIPQ